MAYKSYQRAVLDRMTIQAQSTIRSAVDVCFGTDTALTSSRGFIGNNVFSRNYENVFTDPLLGVLLHAASLLHSIYLISKRLLACT